MESLLKLNQVLNHLKNTFIGKNTIVDLFGIGLIAKENIFLLGPPGTAKSALVRGLSKSLTDGNNFEYLLTRFTEPNELFGPIDIRKLKEGELITNTTNMLPEAALVFLDEIFNANSAILNSLLTALNENIYRRGGQVIKLPAIMFVGASNQLPDDEALEALYDRFLVRVKSDYVEPNLLEQVLTAGRQIENTNLEDIPQIEVNDIKRLNEKSKQVDLSPIREKYVELIHSLRHSGIQISDRRAVKIQNLIAASAVICERDVAELSDLWVLKHTWNTEEQIEILEGLIHSTIQSEITQTSHPRAVDNQLPNAEELAKLLEELEKDWSKDDLTFEERNVIKDKLRHLQDRSAWLSDEVKKEYLQSKIEDLWKQMFQTV